MKQFTFPTLLLLSLFILNIPLKASGQENPSHCPIKNSQVKLTQYWIAEEGEEDMDSHGNQIHLTGEPKIVNLHDPQGKILAKVSQSTYEKCRLEGTCLVNNLLINLESYPADTYQSIDRKEFPWGKTHWDTPLHPFVSVASNEWPRGTTFIIQELKGKVLPNGKIHNGCVRVEDRGWSLHFCQFDLFVLKFSWFLQLKLPQKVTLIPTACQIKNY